MDEFLELIERQLVRHGISKTDFAKKIKISRKGLYRLFEEPQKAKLNTIISISKVLDVDIQEITNSIIFNSQVSSHQIDYIRKTRMMDDKTLALILEIDVDKVEQAISSNELNLYQVKKFSNAVDIPLKYILSTDINISLEKYIDNKSLFDKSQLLRDYYDSLPLFNITICELINNSLGTENSKVENVPNIDYIEEMGQELNLPIANIHVSILMEGNKRPIVIASNLPFDRFYTEHFVEAIFSKVKKRFFNKLDSKEIVWICNTYVSKKLENRFTSLVKFSNIFSNVEFLQLHSYTNRSDNSKAKDIKGFLD